VVPDIRGQQDKVMKTTEDGKPKAQPLQPTPPPRPETIAKAATPKESYTPGDMASAKPAEKTQNSEKTVDAATAVDAQPQPAYERPRTLAEAMARAGTLGHPVRQAGGVNHININSSLDVKSTASGEYDRLFIEAVQARWDQLWENRMPNAAGKVILGFKLYPTGQIKGMTNIFSNVDEFMENMCERAVLDPAPFQPWPPEMRTEIPADYREIQFTFYYDMQ
jgi:hypothetical protein